jgi:hypothetical protein
MLLLRLLQYIYVVLPVVRVDVAQDIYFSRSLGVPDEVLQLKGRDIPFVNNVTYLGVTLDRMTWRHHIERTAAKARS